MRDSEIDGHCERDECDTLKGSYNIIIFFTSSVQDQRGKLECLPRRP